MSRRAVVACPIFPDPPTSGGAKRTLRLLEALAASGANVDLISQVPAIDGRHRVAGHDDWHVEVADPARPVVDGLRKHLYRQPLTTSHDLRRRVRRRLSGARLLQIEHPMTLGVVPRAVQAPLVLSTHNVDSGIELPRNDRLLDGSRATYYRNLLRRVEEVGARSAAAVLCVSEDDCAHFERLASRVLLAPNGVDDVFFDTSPCLPAGDDVLVVGQYSYSPNADGVRRFIKEGWPTVVQRRPGARLVVAGPGGPEAFAESVTEGVNVVGVVDDLPGTMAASRAILVPIWHGGGTRLKAVEALASARPVVGTALGLGGIGFRDGEHGLRADTPAELAEALLRVLADEPASRAFGASARAHAERLRWSRTLDPVRELYAELLP